MKQLFYKFCHSDDELVAFAKLIAILLTLVFVVAYILTGWAVYALFAGVFFGVILFGE